jgi:hypothetical protein
MLASYHSGTLIAVTCNNAPAAPLIEGRCLESDLSQVAGPTSDTIHRRSVDKSRRQDEDASCKSKSPV